MTKRNNNMGSTMDISKTCKTALPEFKTISKNIWGDVVDNIEFKCEQKTVNPHHLASLMRSAKCSPLAMNGHLLRYCRKYTLQLSPRFLSLTEKQRKRILRHEALHIGYPRHTKEFMDVALKVDAPISEASIDKNIISIEARTNGRYHRIMTAQTPDEAHKKAKEYHKNNPKHRVRISY